MKTKIKKEYHNNSNLTRFGYYFVHSTVHICLIRV